MFKSDYNFWLAWHYGQIDRKLTEKEESEIRASEFAMHFLIPTNALLEKCGGYDNLKNQNIYHNYPLIRKLANEFHVSEDIMLFKLDYIMKMGKAVEDKTKSKIYKKEGNIIFIKFDQQE